METGDTAKVKMTPNNPGEYKGTKQTVVTRVALVKNVVVKAQTLKV